MGKGVKTVCKWALALIAACAILSVLFIPVYTMPVHIPNEKGATDYVWKPASFWCVTTEGYSFGRHDAAGFNNKEVVKAPDIVVLGSSHMEAHNVMQDENLCSVLDEKLDGTFRVYNMGISGHTFAKICSYLPEVIGSFSKPPQALVLETEDCIMDEETVNAIIEGDLDVTPSHNTGLLATLQTSPFFRQMYKQMIGGLFDQLVQIHTNEWNPLAFVQTEEAALEAADADDAAEQAQDVENEAAQDAGTDDMPYDMLLSYLSAIQKENNVQIIILYHPQATFTADGSVLFAGDAGSRILQEKAQTYGITFLSASDAFDALYATEQKVPHGFSNYGIGFGHLNPTGHRVLAESLYTVLQDMIRDGRLCR